MLTDGEVSNIIGSLWLLHTQEMGWLDRIYGYRKGLLGRPDIPEGASDELKDLTKLCVMNVLGLVVDSFSQNLSVVGYRTQEAKENDPAWEMWQRNRMDARQHEVHDPALTYGASYVTVTPSDDGPVIRARSPRQLLAVYDDPALDAWPQYAFESWVTQKDAKPRRQGLLYDDTYVYKVDLGAVAPDAVTNRSATQPILVHEVLDVYEHGGKHRGEPVCPVVRFINARDADDLIVGEIAPLIQAQQAINQVNFDRLIVSRWGANPQRVISGWTGTKDEVLKASAMRVWTFGDPNVKAQAFPAASVEPYNSVLDNMLEHVAMVAQISPSQVTGKMVNVSAEALAAAEANQQRKLQAKRDSFGESWEQVLQLAAAMDGDEATAADSGAEVVWRDTEARSFGAVVDGVTKLSAQGVPIELLLPLVPGVSQQLAQGIREAMRESSAKSLVDQLVAANQQPPTVPPPPPNAVAQATQPGAVEEAVDVEAAPDGASGS